MTEYTEECCFNDPRDYCIGAQCSCRCHETPRVTRREWESIKIADFERLEARSVELERRALAVTRMWDALSRCEDEFPPGDPEVAACAEFQERLDMAIDGLMKLVDREMWDRRQAWMREAAEIRPQRPGAEGEDG